MLSRDLKMCQVKLKKLAVENEEFRNKVNEKRGQILPAGSENVFIQFRNRTHHRRGGTALHESLNIRQDQFKMKPFSPLINRII